jgi:hypothetical protein
MNRRWGDESRRRCRYVGQGYARTSSFKIPPRVLHHVDLPKRGDRPLGASEKEGIASRFNVKFGVHTVTVVTLPKMAVT